MRGDKERDRMDKTRFSKVPLPCFLEANSIDLSPALAYNEADFNKGIFPSFAQKEDESPFFLPSRNRG